MLGVRLGFVLFGTFWGAWAVGTLDVQDFLGLSDAGLGLLVAATVGGTLAANVVAGALTERWGTRRATALALGAWGAAVVVLAVLGAPAMWMAWFLVVVALGGMLDVVLNVAATGALHDQPGPLLRVHATYNMGAMGGAALTGAALAALGTWRWAFAAAGVGSTLLSAAVAVGRVPVPDVHAPQPASLFGSLVELRRSRLVGLAAAFALGAAVEGGIGTFGVLYLRDQLEVAALAGAGAYVVGQGLATATRWSVGVGRLGARLSASVAARAGLAVAGVGLAVEAIAGAAPLAGLGLAVASMGIATYWPLLSAVAVQRAERGGLAIGGLTAAGYLGFLAGPPVVGVVADAWSLRAGVLVLAAAAGLAALIAARHSAPAGVSRRRPGSSPGATPAR